MAHLTRLRQNQVARPPDAFRAGTVPRQSQAETRDRSSDCASLQQPCVTIMTETSKMSSIPTPVQDRATCDGAAENLAMSSAGRRHAHVRRTLLTGSAAALALAAGTAETVSGPLAGPDAQLIGLCADLDAMERRISALFNHDPSGLTDQKLEAADASAHLIDVDQRGVLDRICALTPSTLNGYMALGGLLALLHPGLVDVSPDAAMEARLTSTLLRGLKGPA